jgi:hypothetical protein
MVEEVAAMLDTELRAAHNIVLDTCPTKTTTVGGWRYLPRKVAMTRGKIINECKLLQALTNKERSLQEMRDILQTWPTR